MGNKQRALEINKPKKILFSEFLWIDSTILEISTKFHCLLKIGKIFLEDTSNKISFLIHDFKLISSHNNFFFKNKIQEFFLNLLLKNNEVKKRLFDKFSKEIT